MQLIADIGGTSSRWLKPSAGMASLVKLKGFNPVAQRGSSFIEGLERLQPKSIKELTIYGAGCGSEDRKNTVRQLAEQVFSNADITVHPDLLGVARALLGREKGIAAILGTGMNVAYYDGDQLHQRVPSLGYLMGDEGSGADIGKHFLRDLFNRRIPIDLIVKVFPNGNPALAKTISQVYGHEAQNRAMASYVGPLAPYQEETYVKELVSASFKRFTALVQEHHPEEEFGNMVVSGGVAAGFKGILRPVLEEAGVRELKVAEDPLEGLLAFHRSPD